MIRSFRHKGLKRLYERGTGKGIPAEQGDKLRRILFALDCAESAIDLDLPGYALHQLRGDLGGHWSVKLTGNWRVTFRFEAGEVHAVDLVDCH